MDVGAVPKDFKVVALPRRAVPEAWIPDERYHDGAAIHQVDRQGFIGQPRGLSASFLNFNDLLGWRAQIAPLQGA